MKTGLSKKQKTTTIFFDEESDITEVMTHNTDLKNRLRKYASQYPDLCKQTDDNEQGGLTEKAAQLQADCPLHRGTPESCQ